MAFDIFKKKSVLDYPEEKASVLDRPPEGFDDSQFKPMHEYKPEEDKMGEMAPPMEAPQPSFEKPAFPPEKPSGFSAGFRKPDELRVPSVPAADMKEVMSASLRPSSKPSLGYNEGVFPRAPLPTRTPHVFIRINKYQEVMESLNELHRKILSAKEDLEDLHDVNTEESSKLKNAAEIVLKMEDLLRYLESTFTSPEM